MSFAGVKIHQNIPGFVAIIIGNTGESFGEKLQFA